jgi:hypothetical protein
VRFRSLAEGELAERIGVVQAVTGVYGNGLRNNGTHVVDFVRMLVGELVEVRAFGPGRPALASTVPGDLDVSFGGTTDSGATVSLHALDFGHYREVALDLWGTAGRLSILQEGLVVLAAERRPNRGVEGEHEVASDEPHPLASTVGTAYFEMYGNLAAAIAGTAPLWSPGASALRSEELVEAILGSTGDRG